MQGASCPWAAGGSIVLLGGWVWPLLAESWDNCLEIFGSVEFCLPGVRTWARRWPCQETLRLLCLFISLYGLSEPASTHHTHTDQGVYNRSRRCWIIWSFCCMESSKVATHISILFNRLLMWLKWFNKIKIDFIVSVHTSMNDQSLFWAISPVIDRISV